MSTRVCRACPHRPLTMVRGSTERPANAPRTPVVPRTPVGKHAERDLEQESGAWEGEKEAGQPRPPSALQELLLWEVLFVPSECSEVSRGCDGQAATALEVDSGLSGLCELCVSPRGCCLDRVTSSALLPLPQSFLNHRPEQAPASQGPSQVYPAVCPPPTLCPRHRTLLSGPQHALVL